MPLLPAATPGYLLLLNSTSSAGKTTLARALRPHAPRPELQRREAARGDRTPGEAAFHLKTHTFCRYDLEVDTTNPLEDNLTSIVNAWNQHRLRP